MLPRVDRVARCAAPRQRHPGTKKSTVPGDGVMVAAIGAISLTRGILLAARSRLRVAGNPRLEYKRRRRAASPYRRS